MLIILSKFMIRNTNIFPKQKNKSHSSEKSPRQEWGMEMLIDLFSLGTWMHYNNYVSSELFPSAAQPYSNLIRK